MDEQKEQHYSYDLRTLAQAIVYNSAVSGVNGEDIQSALYAYGCSLIENYNYDGNICVSADTGTGESRHRGSIILTTFTLTGDGYEALAALIVGGHEIIKTLPERQFRETLAYGISQRIAQLSKVSMEDLLFGRSDRIENMASSISDLSRLEGFLLQTIAPSTFRASPEKR